MRRDAMALRLQSTQLARGRCERRTTPRGSLLGACFVTSANPLYFGRERELFAWYHPATTSLVRESAVLLCPPLGKEYMCSSRAFRHLAERLSDEGFSTLRLEYFATGNSAGGPEDGQLVGKWLASIASAIDELKLLTGATRIAMVGMRMGGTLAAFAADKREDTGAIVLWEPCANGGRYVRQLRIIAMSNELREVLPAELGIDVAGFRLSPETCEDLSSLQLDQLERPMRGPVLLLSRDDRPSDSELATHLKERGVEITERGFAGYAKIMVPTHESELPERALSDIVDWLSLVEPARSANRASIPPQTLADSGSVSRTALESGTPIKETALRFGDGLFGVLTTPTKLESQKPAVLLLNTGANHHVGPHRSHVTLARSWAAQGLSVLRFDISGLGESPVRSGGRDNDVFPTHALSDIRAAIGVLHEQGLERVAVVGVCSGGVHALQAAQRGLRFVNIIAVNPWLHHAPEAAAQVDPILTKMDIDEVRRNLWSASKWSRFFRGKIRYRHVMRVVTNYVRLLVDTLLPPTVRAANVHDPLQKRNDYLALLTASGVRTHVVFSRGDPSHTYFEQIVGEALGQLEKSPGFTLEVIERCDHDFATYRLQALFASLLTRELTRHTEPRAHAPSRDERELVTSR